jgi:hypothetical protein
MLRAIVFGLFGYQLGERAGQRRTMIEDVPQSSASGWIDAVLILIGFLAWGGVKFSPVAPHATPRTVYVAPTDHY